MSLLIPCPHCGRRPVQEFRYGGEATARRPTAGDAEALATLLYDSDNARGSASEWWQHAAACRTWFVLTRDTARDTIPEAGP
jgi:sarcosine oxidase subunit delta